MENMAPQDVPFANKSERGDRCRRGCTIISAFGPLTVDDNGDNHHDHCRCHRHHYRNQHHHTTVGGKINVGEGGEKEPLFQTPPPFGRGSSDGLPKKAPSAECLSQPF